MTIIRSAGLIRRTVPSDNEPAGGEASLRIRALRRYNHPDLSDYVVHFAGRSGQHTPDVPADIVAREPWDRLAQILLTFTIRAFPPFGGRDPVVCFTECTPAGIRALMAEGRYAPCGIAFAKDTLFQAGGGPALYIRGDEWPHVDSLPSPIRARATRFWPGADPQAGESDLPWNLVRPSEWSHEREWRILGTGDPPGFRFQWEEVAFVLAPDPRWQAFVASYIGSFSDEAYEGAFNSIGTVVVAPDGSVIEDRLHIWIPKVRLEGEPRTPRF